MIRDGQVPTCIGETGITKSPVRSHHLPRLEGWLNGKAVPESTVKTVLLRNNFQ